MQSKIKNYLLKVLIDGEVEILKNFGSSEIEVLDNMVSLPVVDEVIEILEVDTGKKWNGGGSLLPLRKIKNKIVELERGEI